LNATSFAPRFCLPLEDEALWLTFAETCVDAAGVIAFVNEFGRPGAGREGSNDRVSVILGTLF
jgi:hypothetical protein